MESYTDKYLNHIGRHIRAKRLALQMNESTLAKAVGVTQAVISLVEKGKYDCVKTKLLLCICDHLQIPPHELFTPPERTTDIAG